MSKFTDYVPHGVIPAVLLPFHDDFSIDEPSFRAHLRDVAAVQGLSAITVNAHSTEVASCTRDEQRRVMEIAAEEVGGKLPIVHGIWADGSLEAGPVVFDLEADGVGYATSGGQIDDIVDQLDAFKEQIIAGDIVVPTEP